MSITLSNLSKLKFFPLMTLFVMLSFFVVIGCGGPRRSIEVHFVQGKATLDGAPLGNVQVIFVPKDEGTAERATGFTKEDGSFTVSSMNGDPETGAMLGDYAVILSRMERPPGANPGTRPVETLPAVYTTPETTPFNVTIVKGRNKNTFDFALQSQ